MDEWTAQPQPLGYFSNKLVKLKVKPATVFKFRYFYTITYLSDNYNIILMLNINIKQLKLTHEHPTVHMQGFTRDVSGPR